MKDDTLLPVAKRYTSAAIALLAKEYPPSPPEKSLLRRWQRVGKAFEQKALDHPHWLHCLRDSEDELHALDEYKDFVTALRQEPEIARQLDRPVGTSLSIRNLAIEDVTDRLIWRLAERFQRFEFEEGVFADEYTLFVSELRRPEVELTIAAPILGLEMEIAPLTLQQTVELDQLTDIEIAHCLDGGFFPSLAHSVLGHAEIDSLFGVRIRHPLVKLVDSTIDSRDASESFEKLNRSLQTVDAVLHGLRLFQPGQISVAGRIAFSQAWLMGGWTSYQPGEAADPQRRDYLLSKTGAKEFVNFWNDLEVAKTKPSIATAVRRFGYAGNRELLEDKIIDLMIAAESLFLSDSDGGELSYRLAERFALFVGEAPGKARKALFRLARNAYDLRSSVVHGGTPRPNLLKTLNGPVTLEQFAEMTEQLLRIGIRKAVRLGLPDWMEKVFGKEKPSA